MKPERLVVFSDVHIPYHDTRALALTIKVIDYLRPQYVICNGDFLDCYKLSVFDKDPKRIETFEYEIKEGRKILRKIEAVSPGAKRYFMEGNHELRLRKLLMAQAPELYPFISFPDLLQLHGTWQWVKFGEDIRLKSINYTHCVNPRMGGPNANARARDIYEGNIVIGHVHWLAINYKGNAKNEQHVGASFGWLGNPDKADYLHKIEARRWTHGIGIGYIVNNITHLYPVPFINRQCVIEGRVFRA